MPSGDPKKGGGEVPLRVPAHSVAGIKKVFAEVG
jgi:hypothetical protein